MTEQEILTGWKEKTLGEVVESANTGLDAIRRAPIVNEDTGIKCLRIQDISQQKPFHKWGNTKVKPKDYKKYQLKTDDIIMARTCSTGINLLIRNDLNAVFNNGLARIRTNKKHVFPAFLFYIFQSYAFAGFINGISGGTSVQLNMQLGDLLSFEFLLPPLAEQKAIAAILSSFDDKIELLQRQNRTLEKKAQTIFKEWFINFTVNGEKLKVDNSTDLPEGWRMGKLEEEFEIIMGQSPDGRSYNESGEGMIFFQGRAEFQDRFPNIRLYTTEPKRIAEKFDVLVSVRAPVGDINVAFDRCCIGRGLAAVRGKYKSYTLYKIKSLRVNFRTF